MTREGFSHIGLPRSVSTRPVSSRAPGRRERVTHTTVDDLPYEVKDIIATAR
jgi:hypothetical protein